MGQSFLSGFPMSQERFWQHICLNIVFSKVKIILKIYIDPIKIREDLIKLLMQILPHKFKEIYIIMIKKNLFISKWKKIQNVRYFERNKISINKYFPSRLAIPTLDVPICL